jgi:Holliday junction resolvase RusA-like endonuclease
MSTTTPKNGGACLPNPIFWITLDVEDHVVKKNNRPIHGRGQKKWIGKSNRLKQAENYLTLAFKSRMNKLGLQTITGDIHAEFQFYFRDFFTKEGKRSRRLPDLSNLIQLPEDCLQSAGVIENDTDIVCLDGSGRFPYVKNALMVKLYRAS